jgi:WD repeat-containing protein 61
MESSDLMKPILIKDIVIGGHSGSIYTLELDEVSNFIYSGSADHFLTRWNLITGLQDKFAIKLDSAIYSIKLIKKHQLLCIGLHNGNCHIISLKDNKEIKLFKLSNASIFSIETDEKEDHLIISTSDGKLGVWKLPSLEELHLIQLSSGKIRSILINKQLVFLACESGEIRILDYINAKEINRFQAHEGACNCLCLLREKNILISGGKDAFLKFWDWESGEEHYGLPAHNFAIYEITQNDNYFFTASRDKTIKVWNKSNLELVQKLDHLIGGHKRSVNHIQWNNTIKRLYSTGDDQTIISWKLNQ